MYILKDVSVVVSQGPIVFNSISSSMQKYLTIGVKYDPEQGQNPTGVIEDGSVLDDLLMYIKDAIVKYNRGGEDVESDALSSLSEDFGIISLTDKFFEYLKNTQTKIEAIRVSLNDYEQDHREQKLKTLKTKMMVITADDESLNEAFDTITKELYYEFGDKVIDLYSIILTPKMYKIVNNIPVEYRSVLIRVKK